MIRHVKMAFEKYADFSSRSTRSEFWWFILAYTIIMILLSMIVGVLFFMSLDLANGISEEPPAFDKLLGTFLIPFIIGTVFWLGTIIPYLAVLVRRIHDTGNTGWLGILTFVPYVGFIALIVFGVMETQNRTNKWGPVPGEEGDEVSGALIDFDNDVV